MASPERADAELCQCVNLPLSATRVSTSPSFYFLARNLLTPIVLPEVNPISVVTREFRSFGLDHFLG